MLRGSFIIWRRVATILEATRLIERDFPKMSANFIVRDFSVLFLDGRFVLLLNVAEKRKKVDFASPFLSIFFSDSPWFLTFCFLI